MTEVHCGLVYQKAQLVAVSAERLRRFGSKAKTCLERTRERTISLQSHWADARNVRNMCRVLGSQQTCSGILGTQRSDRGWSFPWRSSLQNYSNLVLNEVYQPLREKGLANFPTVGNVTKVALATMDWESRNQSHCNTPVATTLLTADAHRRIWRQWRHVSCEAATRQREFVCVSYICIYKELKSKPINEEINQR
jgi:hypothetical protein